MPAKVSVIVPSYNHAPFIAQCITSIAEQQYSNLEIIVIDDGSKDESPTIINQISQKYDIKFELQKNMGIAATLNKAITKYAGGDLIAICASDDYWLPGKLWKQTNLMRNDAGIGMCFGKVYELINDRYVTCWDENKYRSGSIFEDLFLGMFHMPASTYMIRRNVFDQVGLYRPDIGIEDWFMNLKIAQRYEIGFVDDYLACYRQHGTNVGRNVTRILGEQRKIIEIFRDESLYVEAVNAWERRCAYKLCKYAKYKALVGKLLLNRARAPRVSDLKTAIKLVSFWKKEPEFWDDVNLEVTPRRQ